MDNQGHNVPLINAVCVSKTYGTNRVVNHASIALGKGEVFGLVGRNGAGKTTLMRMLCGFTDCDKDDGANISYDESILVNNGKKSPFIGSLIEAPSLYGNKTVLENMRLSAILTQSSEAECYHVLRQVSMADYATKKASSLSLGMRQRLGLGMAMLGNPKVLILDEPCNGLDPEGIRSFRDIIRAVSESGTAILISSHLLDELMKIADRFAIMKNGCIVETISATTLAAKVSRSIHVATDDIDKSIEVLKSNGINDVVKCGYDKAFGIDSMSISDDVSLNQIFTVLCQNDIKIVGIRQENSGLEQYFIDRM